MRIKIKTAYKNLTGDFVCIDENSNIQFDLYKERRNLDYSETIFIG